MPIDVPAGLTVAEKVDLERVLSSTGTPACAGFAGVKKSTEAEVPAMHDFFRSLLMENGS